MDTNKKRTRVMSAEETVEEISKKTRIVDSKENDEEDWSQENSIDGDGGDSDDDWSQEDSTDGDDDDDESEYDDDDDDGDDDDDDDDESEYNDDDEDDAVEGLDENEDEEQEEQEEQERENEIECRKAKKQITSRCGSMSGTLNRANALMVLSAKRSQNLQEKCLTKYGVKDADTLALVKMANFDVIGSIKQQLHVVEEAFDTCMLSIVAFALACIEFVILCVDAIEFAKTELDFNEDDEGKIEQYEDLVNQTGCKKWANNVETLLKAYEVFYDKDDERCVDDDNDRFAMLLLESIQAVQAIRDFIKKVQFCFSIIIEVFPRYASAKLLDTIENCDVIFELEGHVNSIMCSQTEMSKTRETYHKNLFEIWNILNGDLPPLKK